MCQVSPNKPIGCDALSTPGSKVWPAHFKCDRQKVFIQSPGCPFSNVFYVLFSDRHFKTSFLDLWNVPSGTPAYLSRLIQYKTHKSSLKRVTCHVFAIAFAIWHLYYQVEATCIKKIGKFCHHLFSPFLLTCSMVKDTATVLGTSNLTGLIRKQKTGSVKPVWRLYHKRGLG